MKTLKMANQLFQALVFCKWITYETLICNLKGAISAYSTIMENIYETNSIFHVKYGNTGKL